MQNSPLLEITRQHLKAAAEIRSRMVFRPSQERFDALKALTDATVAKINDASCPSDQALFELATALELACLARQEDEASIEAIDFFGQASEAAGCAASNIDCAMGEVAEHRPVRFDAYARLPIGEHV